MNSKITLVIIAVIFHLSCLYVIATPQHITILNASAVNQRTLDEVRIHAERELRVSVSARDIISTNMVELKSIGRSANENKRNQDICLIVLTLSESPLHATILSNEQVAVINVSALHSDDSVKNVRRLQRWTMRSAAFLFGVGPDVDPHCVMHDYRTMDEFDKLGLNFSPPWGDRFYQAAKARGLQVRPQFQRPRPGMTKVVQPPPPLPKGN